MDLKRESEDELTPMAVWSETKAGTPPTHRSLSQQMSAIGARLTRALATDKGDNGSVAETLTSKGHDSPSDPDSRSVSRGRETYQSSGRGGLGNLRRSSLSRDARPSDGPDDFSAARGREPTIHPDRVFSVGRGGAGNMRSPSRDVIRDTAEAEHQAKLIREHAEVTHMHSSGRGGAGNIAASRSRSRDPAAALHSTGRGGAGNIHAGGSINPEVDEEERRSHAHHEGVHSTGRGGAANITITHEPPIERTPHHHPHGAFESSGRGGAGNIHSRSTSRDPGTRAAPESKEKHGIAAIFDKLSHPHPHPHSPVPDQSASHDS